MVKKYLTIFISGVFYTLALLSFESLRAQELEVFRLQDYNLKGAVKSCLVFTNYGKEEYEFNREGLLTKSVTRYNDEDYDITLYTLRDGQLLEKRVENYRDGEFVRNTSLAHVFRVDTIGNMRITEKILSYNKEFLDLYEYGYDEQGKLISIKRTNRSGIDETTISYEEGTEASTETHYLNDVVLKSIHTSDIKDKEKNQRIRILTKEFMEGEPFKAIEQIYIPLDTLVTEVKLSFNKKNNDYLPTERIYYEYNSRGDVKSVRTVKNNRETVKNYHYQYDGENGNWVKKIVTPDNTYVTRRITYYPAEKTE